MNLTSCLTLALSLFVLGSVAARDILGIEPISDGLRFQLKVDDSEAPWVLQYSAEAKDWEDLAFFQDSGVDLPWNGLPVAAKTGLFRAIQLEEDDPVRRRYLEERSKWRRSGIDRYVFEVQQGFGVVSWHGTVTVVDKAITTFETIEQWPPFFEANPPTIEDLFDRIERAIAQDAVTIDVDWDTQYGYPKSCFIDISELIADEEQSWKVESFQE